MALAAACLGACSPSTQGPGNGLLPAGEPWVEPTPGPVVRGPGPWPTDAVLNYSDAFAVGHPQSVSVVEDGSLAITLTASDPDGDPLTFAIVSAPSHGVLTGVAPNGVYTPQANYFGPDSFTFSAHDGIVHFLFLDGSVYAASVAMDTRTRSQLVHCQDGGTVELP